VRWDCGHRMHRLPRSSGGDRGRVRRDLGLERTARTTVTTIALGVGGADYRERFRPRA
jgi:hypothetical protein